MIKTLYKKLLTCCKSSKYWCFIMLICVIIFSRFNISLAAIASTEQNNSTDNNYGSSVLSKIFVNKKKQYNLTIVINSKQQYFIQNDLDKIVKYIEHKAKSHKTANQKNYWKNEISKRFIKLFNSYGYYNASVDFEINDDNLNIIIVNINPGTRYSISSITINHEEKSNHSIRLPEINYLPIKKSQMVAAKNVILAQEKILKFIEKNNCLLSLNVSHQAVIDHENKTIDIRFLVQAGPTGIIEKIEFKGLKNVKADYVNKLTKLSPGQCFKRSYIAEARRSLQKSGLFSSANPIIISDNTRDSQAVPVVFEVIERKTRSVKAGINYGTDLGIGGVLGWEHRNLFGQGENIRINLLGNQKEQNTELDYIKPFFYNENQLLRVSGRVNNAKFKAFESKESNIAFMLERKLTPIWIVGVGSKLSDIKTRDRNIREYKKYSLFSMPFFVDHDTRNNVLDAKRGYEARFDIAPFIALKSVNKPFIKAQVLGALYYSLPTSMKPVIALKAKTGSILNTHGSKVPTTEQFYVGGSNSVRGYGYQLAGAIDTQKKPIGGKSFIELSGELRFKMSENIGLVSFIDGGFAYADKIPDTDQRLLYGLGIGLRYFTNFGPLRADIAFPLKRRKTIDRPFQLYFGIGQSF